MQPKLRISEGKSKFTCILPSESVFGEAKVRISEGFSGREYLRCSQRYESAADGKQSLRAFFRAGVSERDSESLSAGAPASPEVGYVDKISKTLAPCLHILP